MAANPQDVIAALDAAALELDGLSRALGHVEAQLGPLQAWHASVVEATACDLWDRYTAGTISRLPGEDVRVALAHRTIRETEEGATRLSSLGELEANRRRLMARVSDVRTAVMAQQSILAALREEMRATS